MNEINVTTPEATLEATPETVVETKKKKGTALFISNLIHLILYALVLPAVAALIFFLSVQSSGEGVEGLQAAALVLANAILGVVLLLIYAIVALICSIVGLILSILLLRRTTGARRVISIVALVVNGLFLLASVVFLITALISGITV